MGNEKTGMIKGNRGKGKIVLRKRVSFEENGAKKTKSIPRHPLGAGRHTLVYTKPLKLRGRSEKSFSNRSRGRKILTRSN